MSVTPEQLAAYADGELDEATARAVEQAVAMDHDLQGQLAAHRALKARLSTHFAPIAEQAVPGHLSRLLQTGTESGLDTGEVVNLADARKRRSPLLPSSRRWLRYLGPALAASLILAIVGIGLRPSARYADGPLATTLDGQLAADQTGNEPVQVLISFRDRNGEFCRGYAHGSVSGIVCRNDRGWKVIHQFEGGPSASTEFRQAGSGGEQLFAAAQEMAAGAALDEAEERAARANDWKRP